MSLELIFMTVEIRKARNPITCSNCLEGERPACPTSPGFREEVCDLTSKPPLGSFTRVSFLPLELSGKLEMRMRKQS